MLTLYKREPDGKLLYAEYWIDESQVVEHIGTVGTSGTTSRADFPGMYRDEEEFKIEFLKRLTDQGYKQASELDGYILLIQYPMKSMAGSKRDLWLKDKATEALTNELGWKGLGFVDGHDMGKTANPVPQYALNIYCFVMDEKLGIQAIKRVLKETRLDYTRIKIASRELNIDGEYVLKHSAKKDLEFYV
ncbi:hypothetical protein [Paenibacillus pabuli]|uniref:hypothetical protein n=1 Tax=Paenibacillus pabuli TaxID=1472 RepID=UPI001FFED1C0|nr:hypothetical protein [Paenibacillus pabuli]UPK41865.1 hypothetical protein KET34_21840 [Paenibacillus pabuli]